MSANALASRGTTEQPPAPQQQQVGRNLLATLRLNTQTQERDDAFKEQLLRFVVDKSRQVDEMERHLQDLTNKVAQAQETLDTLRGAVRFLDQRYLESTNQQLQQLLSDYLARLNQ